MKRVLLVEDDLILQRSLQTGLTKRGYEVITANDGRKANQLFAQGDSYDLVILDIMLPFVSGKDLLKHVKNNNAATPVIMITGLSEESAVTETLNSGADAFLRKPLSFPELLVHVSRLANNGN
jgi:DNA-binding response OmpR family regulator